MGTVCSRAPSVCVVALSIGGLAASPGATRVLGGNEVVHPVPIANAIGVTHCQYDERIPGGTRAVRLSLKANGAAGPVVAIAALRDLRSFAGGARPAGWSGDTVTVPLRPVPHRTVNAELCMTAGPEAEVAVLGRNALTNPSPDQPGGSNPRVQTAYLDRVPPAAPRTPRGPFAPLLALLLRLLAG